MTTVEISTLDLLRAENAILHKTVIDKEQEILTLEEQIAWFKRQIFGKRSERIVSDLNSQQLTLEGFENPQALCQT